MQNQNIIPAVDRLFRTYYDYVQSASEDTLFPLLNALHSLDDRVATVHGRQFFSMPEYVALKALRNHFHHGGEVKYAVRVKPLSTVRLVSDLRDVCLVSAQDCEAAIKGARKQYQDETAQAFADTTKVYGTVIDINPCIFNVVVRIYEKLGTLGISGEGDAFREFQEQYNWETTNGYSHYVDGGISAHLIDAQKVTVLMKALYETY